MFSVHVFAPYMINFPAGELKEMSSAAGGARSEIIPLRPITLPPACRCKSVGTRKLTHEVSCVSESYGFTDGNDAIVAIKQAFSRSHQTALDDPGVHGAARRLANYVCKVRRGVMQRFGDMRETNPVGKVFFDKFLYLLHDGASLGSHASMLASSPQYSLGKV